MVAVFDDMTQCTPAEVARLLPRVSQQRREQALRFKHIFGQFACLKSYEMLQQLLQQEYGVEEGELCFTYNSYGKPSLQPAYPSLDFSISHCKKAIAVAVAEGQAVGIDVEAVRHPSESLVRKTMNECEQEHIAHAADPDMAFTALWTQKEAVLKYLGTGIVDNLHEVLTDISHLSVDTRFIPEKGYIYTVCAQKPY